MCARASQVERPPRSYHAATSSAIDQALKREERKESQLDMYGCAVRGFMLYGRVYRRAKRCSDNLNAFFTAS